MHGRCLPQGWRVNHKGQVQFTGGRGHYLKEEQGVRRVKRVCHGWRHGHLLIWMGHQPKASTSPKPPT